MDGAALYTKELAIGKFPEQKNVATETPLQTAFYRLQPPNPFSRYRSNFCRIISATWLAPRTTNPLSASRRASHVRFVLQRHVRGESHQASQRQCSASGLLFPDSGAHVFFRKGVSPL